MKLLVPVAAAATLLASCTHATAPPPPASVSVTTERAQTRSFVSTSDLSGTLVASRSVTVGANAAGRLSSVPVRVGDHVDAGSVIATIDAASYQAALAQANAAHAATYADVAQAQAGLVQAQARASLAAATAARDAELYRSGDVSRQHYDETQSALATARAGVAQAQAAVGAAQGASQQSAAAIDAAAVPLRDTVIRAPFSGIVTQKLADDGAVVNPGSPIVAMEDDRSLEAEIAVPESLIPSMPLGSRVNIYVDAIRANTSGVVRAVIPSAQEQLHTATVRIAVAPRAGLLRGMFARVRVPGEVHESVAVPMQAVVTRAGQTGIFTVSDGKADFVPVDTAQSSNGWVAVSGITAGTNVAVTGVERLSDGTLVALR